MAMSTLRAMQSLRQMGSLRAMPCARAASKQLKTMGSRSFYTEVAPITSSSSMYIESIYGQWKASPSSVAPEWTEYFEALQAGKSAPVPKSGKALKEAAINAKMATGSSSLAPSTGIASATHTGGIRNLVRAYRKRGHEMASLDPLGINEWRTIFGEETEKELDPTFHGFTDADMDQPIDASQITPSLPGLTEGATLREVVDVLKRCYCTSAGFQYTHINGSRKEEWLRDKIEDPNFLPTDKASLMAFYSNICKVDTFEKFLTVKYKTVKRFGIDGAEAAVSGLNAAIAKGVEMGVTEVIIGMPHRGRLNVMTNVVGKPLAQMFAEFKGSHYDFDKLMDKMESTDWAFAGDVKYHLGTSHVRQFAGGKTANITLECNPSHLETVNAVTLGRTRAKQYYAGNGKEQQGQMLPVIYHGDASFAGQGVVYETMQFAHVKDFDVGGTIHVIVNNQVGFTTDPVDDRSTMYCCDLGKGFNIPIFHVNADDAVAVSRVFELAVEWRQKFATDVIVDVIGYRRYGHNETQNPDYTQPLLYKAINKHPRAETIFADKLVASGVATKEELDAIRLDIWQQHEAAFVSADTQDQGEMTGVATQWSGMATPYELSAADPTAVDLELLKKVGLRLCEAPEGFAMHKMLGKQLAEKRKTIETGEGLNWATAEALAWGTLLLEGKHVRLTGQDSQSGTFAHRHSVIRDQNTMEEYCFLNNMKLGEQEQFVCRNSILSEYGVLGFELGYSYENPHALNIWEAQFGDFANTAQVMFDQFLSAGEQKWYQQSGLVILLPHGYEGQGAEHSSARLERFLQMVDDDEDDIPTFEKDFGRNQIQKANWQVVNVTTPANVFHMFRRQVHRNFRKPLVVASTKSLFRHKLCKSDISEFSGKSCFQRLYGERDAEIVANADNVDRLVICSGKLYYELLAKREELGLKNVAIATVEQIAPFPFDRVLEQLKIYKNVPVGDGLTPGNVIWCQEEPKNMGAWSYVKPRLVTTFREGLEKDVVIRYVGRRAASSPATGYAKMHHLEQETVISEALLGDAPDPSGMHRPTGLLGHMT